MKEIISIIKSNGIKSDLPKELKQNLEISNIFNVIDMFLVIPFIILFWESPIASILTSITILAHLLSFILIRYHKYDVGRFIFSITTATTVYFVAALIYNDDGTDGMAAKFLILGTIIMPFIVFTRKEWKYTMTALFLDLFYIISFNYMNGLIGLPGIHNVDSPELRLISIITTFIIFCSIFFYYKNLIIEQNLKLEQSNIDLVEKNKELKELNATKNKFFTIIAHDLRGPLNAILGCAEMLLKNHKIFDEEELELFSKTFFKTSENTCKTVENLLTWSHSQLNKVTRKPTSINVNIFVSDIIVQLQEISNLKEIKVENHIGQSLYAKADRDIANVVLQNLLSNAIKFSHRNSTIKIGARQVQSNKKDYIEICVADSGLGMNTDTIEKLFKIENTKSLEGTENEQGTGLGLLLCKEFAEKNDGRIYVESELGKGSRFYFTLPLLESKSSEDKSYKKINNTMCIA